MNVDDYYFVKCEKVEEQKFSELEKMLRDMEGIEVQYSFPYLARIAVIIEDKKIVEDLMQKGYIMEKQNKLLALPIENTAEKQQILRKLDAEQP